MKSYDDIEDLKPSMASEPRVVYGSVQPSMPRPYPSSDRIPEGYMSLRRFGELFHQKLDACYAQLQSDIAGR